MFDPEQREVIRTKPIAKAEADPRISAAALVGSTASGGDRWSDLDLTFGVADGTAVETVIADWTDAVVAEFAAAVLFDLSVDASVYRVFLMPGALQVDLSFTPQARFGARGPRFHLLFGETTERPWGSAPSVEYQFGMGVHHAVRAHVCIERGLLWQAEYWVHGVRDQALTLACYQHGIETSYARGFDRLPEVIQTGMRSALVRDLTADELRRALAVATQGLLDCAGDLPAMRQGVAAMLAEICHPTLTASQ